MSGDMTYQQWQDRMCSLARRLEVAAIEFEDYLRREPEGKCLSTYAYEVTETVEHLRELVRKEPGREVREWCREASKDMLERTNFIGRKFE